MKTTLQFEVGKPKADATVFCVELDGATVASSTEGPVEGPDVTMILGRDELDEVVAGDLALDVGYMQGRVKVGGNVGRMLSVLPVLSSDEFIRELRTQAGPTR